MESEFKDKVAIVTGGANGIGRAVSIKLAGQGALVVVADIKAEAVNAIDGGPAARMGAIHTYTVDVSSPADVAGLFQKVRDDFGRLDILVNCAGINSLAGWGEITPSEWDRVVNVNMRGVFLCCQEAAGIMKRQRSGSIVNISSGAAKTGGGVVGPHYAATKAGVIALTISLAKHLGPYGVRVNGVAPGVIETGMIKDMTREQLERLKSDCVLGRFGTPEDVADAVIFLISDKARWITGEILDVNGGDLMD